MHCTAKITDFCAPKRKLNQKVGMHFKAAEFFLVNGNIQDGRKDFSSFLPVPCMPKKPWFRTLEKYNSTAPLHLDLVKIALFRCKRVPIPIRANSALPGTYRFTTRYLCINEFPLDHYEYDGLFQPKSKKTFAPGRFSSTKVRARAIDRLFVSFIVNV